MKIKKEPPKKQRNYLHLEHIKRKGAGSGCHGKKGYSRKVKHKKEE